MRAWIESKGVRRTEPEYELRDALGQSGCAICRLALRTSARQLDILSYENVNDLDLRARLRDARGFCNRHAWHLLEQTRDPLGVALIYKDVVNTLVHELRPTSLLDRLRSAWRRGATGGLAGRLAASRGCPVCLAERETEDVYVRLLGARLSEASFREAWARSDGLCWPHLLDCLPRARSSEALALLAEGARSSALPLADGAGSGEGGFPNEAIIHALALSHGRWSAERAILPPALIVDLKQQKLDAVNRPTGNVPPECHACRETALGMERRLNAELLEGISAEALGLTCERHAWQLAREKASELADPLPKLAAGRKAALAAALDREGGSRPAVLPPGQAPASWLGERVATLLRDTAGCALCEREAALDRETAASAAGMRRAVALCRTHLMLAARSERRDAQWEGLLRHEVVRWRALSADLAEFIRKHDYRFSQEARGEERDSPWRAVEEIAGRKGGR